MEDVARRFAAATVRRGPSQSNAEFMSTPNVKLLGVVIAGKLE
jgi:hypothetical protein